MKNSCILLILLCFCLQFGKTQVPSRTICKLPNVLVESSGLYVPSPDSIWSHGDSGNPAELYLIDTMGKLKRTVKVQGVFNTDWEELAADSKGNLYVGDFGNNANNRRDLAIYKIIDFRNLRTDTVTPQIIRFSYEDQTAFPPPLSNYVYDAEAMLVFDDSIFIATKDFHAKPYIGITRIYRIPNRVGTHIAAFVAQVVTDGSDKQYGGITGMAMSADRKKVVLISHSKLYLAENFAGRAFWTVPWRSTTISPFTSREAVAFVDSCQLYLSDDLGSGTAGNLFGFDLCKWQSSLTSTTKEVFQPTMTCFPNPSVIGQDVTILFKNTLFVDRKLRMFDVLGRKIATFEIGKGVEKWVISRELLENGRIWLIQMEGNNQTLKLLRF